MKALTIRQPWASFIALGEKDIENRNWPTRFRGRVAIHASARLTDSEVDAAFAICNHRHPNIQLSVLRERVQRMPLGSILGTVDIVDCVTASDSPWFFGTYGFVLKDAKLVQQPIPCKGALSFWTVPDEIAAQLEEAGL